MGSLLCLVLLPAVAARQGLNAKSFQCLDNVRQMVNAWRMYADDNRDVMVYASTGGSNGGRSGNSVPVDTPNPSDPNNFAWTGAHLDFSPTTAPTGISISILCGAPCGPTPAETRQFINAPRINRRWRISPA